MSKEEIIKEATRLGWQPVNKKYLNTMTVLGIILIPFTLGMSLFTPLILHKRNDPEFFLFEKVEAAKEERVQRIAQRRLLSRSRRIKEGSWNE